MKSTTQMLTDQKHITFTKEVYPIVLKAYDAIKEAVTREQIVT